MLFVLESHDLSNRFFSFPDVKCTQANTIHTGPILCDVVPQTPMQPTKNRTESGSKWIWPFELLEQIGEGGMGVVYRARYVVNDRQVALKMLPSDVNDETALARFERELAVLKSLKHPNIVRCFGGSCENQRRFYAMELIKGGTLEDQLHSQKKLRWEQVVEYGIQMCSALDASHRANVIHRDVKPSNFLIADDGTLKLSDFGLASVAASRRITAAGKTAGTFLYMAPEQIRGHAVTPQTDLYALGCVLYELVTGKPPFLAETPAATLHMHCHAEPERPTVKALDCPPALEQIILSLMAKSDADRPQSAGAVARQLKQIDHKVRVVTQPRDVMLSQEAAKPVKPKSIIPEEVRRPSKSSSLATLVLGVLLALSLIVNLWQAFRPMPSRRWQSEWLSAAHSTNKDVQLAAVETIGHMTEHSPRNLALLVQLAENAHNNIEVREASIRAIGEAGGYAKLHLPALIRIQKEDPQQSIRDVAEQALSAVKQAPAVGKGGWTGLLLGGLLLATLAGTGYWLWRHLQVDEPVITSGRSI